MRRVYCVLMTVAMLLVAGRALAAEEKKGPENRQPPNPAMDILGRLKNLNLTDEQKAKVEDLKKEYEPKFKELGEQRDKILTEEQKKAREEAFKAARASGKRGPDVRKEIRDSLKLTDDQKAQLDKADKAFRDLGKEFREKVSGVLTAEQKEKLKKQFQEHRRPHGEKQ